MQRQSCVIQIIYLSCVTILDSQNMSMSRSDCSKSHRKMKLNGCWWYVPAVTQYNYEDSNFRLVLVPRSVITQIMVIREGIAERDKKKKNSCQSGMNPGCHPPACPPQSPTGPLLTCKQPRDLTALPSGFC